MQPRLFACSLVLCACGGSVASEPSRPAPQPPPRPEISVDPACQSHVETIASIEGNGLTLVQALAVAPDGTAYFGREDVADKRGVYAVDPGGGGPRRIADLPTAEGLWIDGDAILVAAFGRIYRVPRAGGDATQVGELPPLDDRHPELPLATTYAFDGSHVYILSLTYAGGAKRYDVSRIPKQGGAAELLASSADDTYNSNARITFDDGSLYIGASGTPDRGFGVLLRMPKTGGTPAIVRTSAYDVIGKALVRFRDAVYSSSFSGPLTRWPLDPSSPPTPIEGIARIAVAAVADDAGAYTAILTGIPDLKSRQFGVAFARIPTGVEHTTSVGCTEARSVGLGWNVSDMALDATHLYALAHDMDSPSDARHYAVLRMPR